MGRIVVVGGINRDTIVRLAAEPVWATSNPATTTSSPGGVARNIAENLARLGEPVSLVGAIGDDGDDLLDELRDLDVDVTGVRRGDLPTGSYLAVISPDGSLVIGTSDMRAADTFTDLPHGLFDETDVVVIDGNLGVEVIHDLLTRARQASVPVVLDPIGVAKAARLAALSGFPGDFAVHTFTPTLDELLAFAQVDDLDSAVRIAHERGVEVVWVRQGAAGSTLYAVGTDPVHIPAYDVPVVNVTGAGDAMLAGYVRQMHHGLSREAAAQFGTAAAALTVAATESVSPHLNAAAILYLIEENE